MSATITMMNLRYSGTCRECGSALAAGAWAGYDRGSKTVLCAACTPTDAIEPAPQSGVAGASAQRKFDEKHDRREARIRTAHPHLGGAILALTDDPQSTRAWAKGAQGEVALGRRLDAIDRPDVRVLHDRRIPGSKANIDHIAIGPRGVFVIDAKNYTGAPSLQTTGGLFSPKVEKLMVRGHDQTHLAAGVLKQIDRVMTALESVGRPDIPVFGMLCFVEAEWPLLGGDFTIGGVDVLWPRKAAKKVASPGSFGEDDIQSVFVALARYFPEA